MIRKSSFRIKVMGESDPDTRIAPVYSKYENPVTTVLSAPGDLSVHLPARCATEAEADALLKEVGDPIAELLGDRVYRTDPEQALEMVVGNLLRTRHATVAQNSRELHRRLDRLTVDRTALQLGLLPGRLDYLYRRTKTSTAGHIAKSCFDAREGEE